MFFFAFGGAFVVVPCVSVGVGIGCGLFFSCSVIHFFSAEFVRRKIPREPRGVPSLPSSFFERLCFPHKRRTLSCSALPDNR